jgi:hypothetical protein
MSVASPLNVFAAFQNAGINLAIADEKSTCRITPRSGRCLMASADVERQPSDEAVSGGEGTEAQLYLEGIVTDTEELEEEEKTNLNQVYNDKLLENGVGSLSSIEGL